MQQKISCVSNTPCLELSEDLPTCTNDNVSAFQLYTVGVSASDQPTETGRLSDSDLLRHIKKCVDSTHTSDKFIPDCSKNVLSSVHEDPIFMCANSDNDMYFK